MRQFFGMSQSGNLLEAVQGLRNTQLIMLLSNNEQFEAHVVKLESLFPHVPSIRCMGMCYDTRILEKGVGIIAFYDGVSAVTNVPKEVSANDRVYRDAVAYALVKNLNGRVKTYKENIYHQNILHVSKDQISTQTFKNPFGKIMKLHKKSRKETKSLYPVLYVIERLKEYRNMLVQNEVDSLQELSMVSKSFNHVLQAQSEVEVLKESSLSPAPQS